MVVSSSNTSICPSCSSVGEYYCSYQGTHPIFTDKNIHTCTHCGLYYVVEMPSPEDLFDYNSLYWTNAHSHIPSQTFDNPWFALLASLRYDYLSEFISMDSASILEIGPGEGYLARHISSRHSDVIYDVLESDSNTRAMLFTFCDSIYDHISAIPRENKYDLIIISHVLEHVANPRAFIDSIIPLLDNNSLIFIEVPCLDFTYKAKHDPHLLFFDKPSLSHLLSFYSLDLIDLSYAGKRLSNTQSTLFSTLIFSLIRKLSKFIPFIQCLFPDFGSLEQISCFDQKLLSLQYSAHHRSVYPSCWLRSISVFSSN